MADNGRIYLGALLALAALAFAPFALAPFFLDDLMVFRPEGPVATLASLPRILTGRCILFPPGVTYDYYRPLIDALFVFEYAAYGQRPLGYHFTNYALHLANIALAWRLFSALPESLVNARTSALGLALFALHPIQVESVLWIAARPGILSLFWVLIGLNAWVGFVNGRPWLAAPALLCFIAALLSKEVAVAALLLLPLLALIPPAARLRAICLATLHVIIALAYLALNPAAGAGFARNLGQLGPAQAIGTLATFTGFYTRSIAIPFGLMPVYPVGWEQYPLHLLLGGALMLLGLALVVIWIRNRSAATAIAATGLAYGFGSALLPIVGGQFQAADRYMYQSMLGFALVATVAANTLARTAIPRPRMLAAMGAGLAVLTFLQAALWTQPKALWRHCIRADPLHFDAHTELGDLALLEGDTPAAIEHLTAAVLSPRRALASIREARAARLAGLLLQQGRPSEAEPFARIAMQSTTLGLRPRLVLAAILLQENRQPEAATLLETAQPTEIDGADEYLTLALLCRRLAIRNAESKIWYAEARRLGAAPNRLLEQAPTPQNAVK